MLLALRHPVVLVGLLLGVGLALVARRYGQRLAARLLGLTGAPRVRAVGDLLEPYGAVALLLSGAAWGPGWPLSPRLRRRRARGIAVLLAGPLVAVVAGLAVLAGYLVLGGDGFLLRDPPIVAIMHGSGVALGDALVAVPYSAGVAAVVTGLLAFVPLPPLDGFGVLLLALPAGPRRDAVELAMAERGWGVLALLVLAIVPLAGQPVLLSVVGAVAGPLVGLLGGGG